jgi:parvulin-like peptidyl-prolyl isomerase
MVRQFWTGILIGRETATARNQQRRFVSSCFRSVIFFVALGAVIHAETLDRVLAVVAGQVILLSDVTAARDLGLQTAAGAADPVRLVLDKLIDRELVLAEVDRYAPPEPEAAAVDREIARVHDRFASAQAFEAALERSGIDDKHLRETLRQDLRAAAYLDQRFASAGDRRAQLVTEWVTGLRRRADVIDLYLSR